MKADELEIKSTKQAHIEIESGFINLSGRLDGGSEPTAFQCAERERMLKSAAEKNLAEGESLTKSPTEENAPGPNIFIRPCENLNNDLLIESPGSDVNIPNLNGNEIPQCEGPENILFKETADGDDIPHDESLGVEGNSKSFHESETLSDIDNAEVESYLMDESHKNYKQAVWEMVHREYLEEQAAKEAAAAAAKEALEANFRGRPEEFQAAQELAAATAAAVSKSKLERQQKRAVKSKNLGPAKNASESTWKMLTKKRQNSKINYSVLDRLFEETDNSEKSKKAKVDGEKVGEKMATPEICDGIDEGEFGDEECIEPSYDHDYYDGIAVDSGYYYGDADEEY